MARTFSGARLREVRLAAGKPPERLALDIERSVSAIHSYEYGRALPSVGALGRLADALRVPVDALFVDGSAVDAA